MYWLVFSAILYNMSFTVATESFNGPMHVLLELIEKRKMHISEISLAAIANDFLSYTQTTKLPYADITGFMVVAATLVLIKVKSLLPEIVLSNDEQLSLDDLQIRLHKYAVIKKYAEKLIVKDDMQFWVGRPKNIISSFTTDLFITEGIPTLPQIHAVVTELLQKIAPLVPEKKNTETIRAVHSMESIIQHLTELVGTSASISWNTQVMSHYHHAIDTVEKKHIKREIVVSFLALLELFKKGTIMVNQESVQGDIILEKAT